VGLEFALGIWLLFGFFQRQARHVSITCFVLFLLAALYEAGSGETSCGCFGHITVSPWYTAILDLVVLAALVAWHPVPPLMTVHLATRFGYLACGLILCAGSFGWMAATHALPAVLTPEGLVGDGETVLLEPEKWIGKRLPLLTVVDIGEELAHGKWLLIFYRDECPKCRKIIPGLEEMVRGRTLPPTTVRLAFIHIQSYAAPGRAILSTASPCKVGHLDAGKTWMVPTPALLSVEDGVVHRVDISGQESAFSIMMPNSQI
jgi:hypothetical protein